MWPVSEDIVREGWVWNALAGKGRWERESWAQAEYSENAFILIVFLFLESNSILFLSV